MSDNGRAQEVPKPPSNAANASIALTASAGVFVVPHHLWLICGSRLQAISKINGVSANGKIELLEMLVV